MGLQRKTGAGSLKPRPSSHAERRGLRGFGESQDQEALGCSCLPCGLGSKRDFAWKKRGERTLAGGP